MNGAGRPCDVIYRNARRESFPTEHAHYVRRGNAPNLNDPRPLLDHLNYARVRRPLLRYAAANYGASAS